ncbi:MAG: DUF1848 family protein [Desulfobacterales bacterium]
MKIILSASRRTDIPAFYIDWFMDRIAAVFETVNPYNQKKTRVPATPDHVHTIVFWSKNFSRFLSEEYGEALRAIGYHLFFHFTVNSEIAFWSPVSRPFRNGLNRQQPCAKGLGRTLSPGDLTQFAFHRAGWPSRKQLNRFSGNW